LLKKHTRKNSIKYLLSACGNQIPLNTDVHCQLIAQHNAWCVAVRYTITEARIQLCGATDAMEHNHTESLSLAVDHQLWAQSVDTHEYDVTLRVNVILVHARYQSVGVTLGEHLRAYETRYESKLNNFVGQINPVDLEDFNLKQYRKCFQKYWRWIISGHFEF